MLNLHTKEIEGKEKIFQVDLKGILDFETSDSFINFIEEKINSGIKRFIVNCKNLSYITSSGISSIVQLNIEIQESQTALVYSELNPEVKLLFSLFGFDKKFLVAEDNSSAEKILQNLFLPNKKEITNDEQYFGKVKNIEFSFDNRVNENTEDKTEINNQPQISPTPIIQVQATDWIKISKENHPENSITANLQEKIKHLQETNEESEIKNKISTQTSHVLQQNLEHLDEEPELISLSENPIIQGNVFHLKFPETVFHCESCGNPIRIMKHGKHKCPICDSIFSVRQNGSVSYLEKLI